MRLAIISLILLLLNTCSHSNSPSSVKLNQPFEIKFQESVNLKTDKVKIRFVSVLQDSRCPKTVQCIVAGKANIELELKTSQKTQSIQLTTDPASNEATYGQFKIKLIDVSPYPDSAEKIESTRYVATLEITKANDH